MADRYAEQRSRLPTSYVAFIESHGGWAGDLGDELGYVILWDRNAIQETYDACEMAEYLSARWFAFGSDGGGEMLCFDLLSRTEQIFWMPYIGMSDEAAMLRYSTFQEIATAVLKYNELDPAPENDFWNHFDL